MCLRGLRDDQSAELRRDLTLPMPRAVAEAVQCGTALPTRGLTDDALGSFCVRCLLWRPPGARATAPCATAA